MSSVNSTATAGHASTSSALGTVANWITTTDHKKIGRLFVGASALWMLVIVGVGVALGIERIAPDSAIFNLNSVTQLFAILRTGATFGVSPGATDLLLDACEANELPLLPGIATSTEAMRLLERGYTVQKFFPAEANGGAPALKAIGAPLPQISFCPTGGVSLKNANDYLSLSNTLCVGGSWVAPASLVASGDWDGITALAAEAAKLPR